MRRLKKTRYNIHVCRLCKNSRSTNHFRVCRFCEPGWAKRNAKKRETKARLRQAFEELIENGPNVCYICGLEPLTRRLSVDHCHRTGKVRGLLCYVCNYGLRWFRDDPARLRAAAKYLETRLPQS